MTFRAVVVVVVVVVVVEWVGGRMAMACRPVASYSETSFSSSSSKESDEALSRRRPLMVPSEEAAVHC